MCIESEQQTEYCDAENRQSKLMNLTAPIHRWDEAIPLGNGLIGALLWGSDNDLRFSLDRGDLWDCRTVQYSQTEFTWANLKKLVDAKDVDQINKIFFKPHTQHPYPTKLPAGRLQMTLDKSVSVQNFQLDMTNAVGRAEMANVSVESFCDANSPVLLIRIKGDKPRIELIAPAYTKKSSDLAVSDMTVLSVLGYKEAKYDQEGTIKWYMQNTANDFSYVVMVGWREKDDGLDLALTISTSNDSKDAVDYARKVIISSLDTGYDELFKRHIQWWKSFWAKSDIAIPNLKLEQHYNLAQYLYGSGSRRGFAPLPLQGLWTADEGHIPPWRGDYHNDLNTQFTYYTYLAANHRDEGLCFLEFLSKLLPAFRNFAKQFYNTSGACVPGVMAIDGQSIGGWPQYSFSPTNSVWLGHIFYLHWRYTMDRTFLCDVAYLFCEQIGICVASLLKSDENGKLKLPLSTSPEYHNASLKAWLAPNSNYDLSLMRWLFAALSEMAQELGNKEAAGKWNHIFSQLDSLALSTEANHICDIDDSPILDALMLSPDEPQLRSHHHFSPLMAIYPLGTLNIDGTDKDRRVIGQSIYSMDSLGQQGWGGYQHAWMSCIAARTGRADRALLLLDIYLKAFISRNGFMLNRDFKDIGASAFKGRYFTIEGNMMAALAVQEMLLQSWEGIIRIFPAVPSEWDDITITDMRAEGAFLVSAKRIDGKVTQIEIKSEKGTLLNLKNPWQQNVVVYCNDKRVPISIRNDIISWQTAANYTYRVECNE